MSKEYDDYSQLLDSVQNNVLKQRIDLSLKYYIEMAVFYKKLWNVLSILCIVLPATATFLASIYSYTCLIQFLLPLITALSTLASSLLAVFKCADKKNSYRNSAENLKSEINSFANKSSVYAKCPENNEALLCERVEKIIKEGYSKIVALESNQGNEEKPDLSDCT